MKALPRDADEGACDRGSASGGRETGSVGRVFGEGRGVAREGGRASVASGERDELH